MKLHGTTMRTTLPLLTTPLLFPMLPLHAQSSQTDAAGVGDAVASRLEEFLGAPLFVPMQQLWEKRGAWGGVLTAKDGTVVAFQSPGGGNCRRSRDGGQTWDADIEIAPDATGGRALVDETKGDLRYVNPAAGWLLRSRDSGATWTPSQRRIYLLFEGGPKGCHEAVQVVSFNLSWLLNGRDLTTLLGKTH